MNPDKPGFYLSHVSQAALIQHKPELFWDGENWCSNNSPYRSVQKVQSRYWCELNGGKIHHSAWP